MRDLLRQIDSALDANLYYVALIPSLAIPDICGALEAPDGQASRIRYVAWFDKYVGPKYKTASQVFFSGEDCYYYRCSILHQGTTQHPKSTYSRVIFVEPTASGNVFHCNILNDALNIDVRLFCRDLIAAAHTWLADAESTATYQGNIKRFLTRYPQGLPPYIVGTPVYG